jgi:ketosteroid isomerase-like protein
MRGCPVLVGLLVASFCVAQTGSDVRKAPVLRGQTTGAAVQEVRMAKEEYDEAQLKNDSEWFERMFAEDYLAVLTDGSLLTKARAVQELRSREITWDSVKAVDVNVRVYDDTAVVTGRFVGAGKYKGEAMKENQRFTSVWIKRQGRWQAIAEHFTTISSPQMLFDR